MSPFGRLFLVSFASAFLLLEVYSESIVDDVTHCGLNGCPGNGDSSYKTYCCSDHSNRNPAISYSCCNPYIKLYVGLSVGIPIVLVLIIAVIVLYCCWWNRNRKKRLQLMQLYLASRVNCDRDEIRTLDAAPPPYTPTENDELPSYTKDDPYSSLKEDSTEGDLERSDESSQNDSNNHIEEIPLLQS